MTPLYIALGVENDAAQRAIYLVDHGADILCTTNSGADIFAQICSNTSLSDQQSYDLILLLLSRLEPNSTPTKAYSTHFLSRPSAVQALFKASSASRLKTLTLLLSSLGLHQRINDLDKASSPSLTALDHALQSAEHSRRQHLTKLSAYAAGSARARALEQKLVYDNRQGLGPRAAEAYESWPAVLELLLSHGAKRACEVDSSPRLHDTEYIDQPGFWDLSEIFATGFTPRTQPNQQNWKLLYELARYPASWKDETLALMKEQYEYGIWRPNIKALEEDMSGGDGDDGEKGKISVFDLLQALSEVSLDQRQRSKGAKDPEEDSTWIRVVDDGSEGTADVEVEVINGKLGRKRTVKVE